MKPPAWLPWVLMVSGLAGFGLFAMLTGPGLTNGAPDFPNYYYPGGALAAGESIYVSVADQVTRDFGAEAATSVEYPADPPTALLALAWLHVLPYSQAWWALAALATVAFWVAIFLSGKAVGLTGAWAAAVASIGLLSTSYRFHFFRNHFESVVLLLGVSGWLALRSDRPARTGVVWGLAAALKAFPGLWIVTAMRRGRVVAAAAGTLAVLAGITVMAVGWSDIERFFVDVVPLSQQWYGARGNYSLLSAGYGFGAPAVGWALLGAGAVAYAYTATGFGWTPDGIFAQGVVWSLLLSPLNWLNYLILAFPVLILVGSRIDWSRGLQRWGMILATVALVFWRPLPADLGAFARLGDVVPTLALVGLAASLPGMFARRRI